MPVCEGRPDGPCPDKRADRTVRATQGDLFLCDACDKYRFPASTLKYVHIATIKSTKKGSTINTDIMNESTQPLNESQSASRTIRSKESTSTASVAVNTAASSVSSAPSGPSPGPSCALVIASTDVQLHAIVGTTGAKKVVLNDLLAYIHCYRQNSTDEAVQTVVVVHFSRDDIAAAKRLLIQEFQSMAEVTQFTTERRNSFARQAHETKIEDVIGILDIADTKNALVDYVFVAFNLQSMPKYGPEEINLAVVVNRQVQTYIAIANLSASVEQLTTRSPPADLTPAVQHSIQSVAIDMQHKLGAFNDAIGARLDHLHSVCTQLAKNAGNVVYTSPRVERKAHDVDRSMNVMVFGVSENKDVRIWRNVVDRALLFFAC
jgi:hypothetical protein